MVTVANTIDIRNRRRSMRGFTVVEMLVTVAIIITLVGILVVGLTQASGAAQRAQTKFLMNSMAAGLAQFKGDHGYLPPVLGDNGTPNNLPGWSRDVLGPPFCGSCPNIDLRQSWFSVTTPAEYLLGYGDRTADGYGIVGDIMQANSDSPGYIETPPLGFRAPGSDGAWGAIVNPRSGFGSLPGVFAARNPGNAGLPYVPNPTQPNAAANNVRVRGRIYGPYLELKDANLLGGLRPDGTIARPEDDDYDIQDEDEVGLEGGEGYGDYDMLEAAEVDADEDKAEEERANLAELFKQAQVGWPCARRAPRCVRAATRCAHGCSGFFARRRRRWRTWSSTRTCSGSLRSTFGPPRSRTRRRKLRRA